MLEFLLIVAAIVYLGVALILHITLVMTLNNVENTGQVHADDPGWRQFRREITSPMSALLWPFNIRIRIRKDPK